MTEGDGIKRIPRRLLAAVEAGDRQAFVGTFAPDAVVHAAGGEIDDLETFVDGVWAFHDAFPDFSASIEVILAEGDLVAFYYTATATHRRALEDIAPTGETVEVRAMRIARVVDGRVAELWLLSDPFGLLRQLGAVDGP